MLDVGKLATFRAVLAAGSFSAAAEALALTQPAVSRQVSLLEAQVGTQLVLRTRQGVQATEAGRLLAAHADAILDRVALAEAQVAALAGLRSGHVRLGSFLSALVHLSSQLAVRLEQRHPELFSAREQPIRDELVDRDAALRRLAAGELDLAVVFEHAFEPQPHPGEIELVPLFDDPPRVLLPAAHRLAAAAALTPRQLARETWIRAHHGSAARLVDHVLAQAHVRPAIRLAGHGDEPIEAQALIAAGHGITIAHELNVLIAREQIAVVPLAGGSPVRHVHAALVRGQRAPVALAALEALREIAPSGRA
jgi:DNA-binding transcriptional LysR family regulator